MENVITTKVLYIGKMVMKTDNENTITELNNNIKNLELKNKELNQLFLGLENSNHTDKDTISKLNQMIKDLDDEKRVIMIKLMI